MPAQTVVPDCAIAELFYQVCQSGKLTRSHRYGLMSALLECALSEEDQAAIDRLIHATRRGWVTILD
ncbi:MAG TPA: hypothetical protein VK211_15825 [Kamptonema sp.]|nr:hypothetical protein [Kamptonema sp.]